MELTREFPPSSCVAHGDSESTLGARSRCLNRGRPSRCVRIRARTTVPINLVMGEKLPRLRLKTHPATAIFSQHLRITRNCRSFVPFLPSLCRRSVPGNPRAVHCLTPRTPCRERRNEMRKGEERERERRGIIVMSNRKLTLNRGPSTVSFLLRDTDGLGSVRSREEKHARPGTSVHPALGSSVSNRATVKISAGL